MADATFFGKRRAKFGVLVFKDVWSGNILIWKYIESETIKDYIIDGKRGLFKAFNAKHYKFIGWWSILSA